MDKIEEEVPTNNISGGEIAQSGNTPLGGKKKVLKKVKSASDLYKRWLAASEVS